MSCPRAGIGTLSPCRDTSTCKLFFLPVHTGRTRDNELSPCSNVRDSGRNFIPVQGYRYLQAFLSTYLYIELVTMSCPRAAVGTLSPCRDTGTCKLFFHVPVHRTGNNELSPCRDRNFFLDRGICYNTANVILIVMELGIMSCLTSLCRDTGRNFM